ncbi:Pr6Pr family membrane protein [Steroidobacter sp.]|uniref:Pr6Pr family membrane protein n=1 Tax=Steroidobacter sp. TaxID=1978227 RepID=UPI001A4A0BAD|nr:Pr6Pr family membrane protein [Steroidobacter sp.]MBL8264781.1 Pr6Pr family membrane protein [Steroidobacter sp.]
MRSLSRAWHAILAAVIVASLIVQIILLVTQGADVTTGAENEAVSLGTRFVRFFSYFTIQSNLLVLAAALTLAMNPEREGSVWRVLRLDALVSIAITGIVFTTVLASQVQHSGWGTFTNAGFHYFAPVWALLGWGLFGPRPRIAWSTVAWSFVWPALWVGYTLAHGAASNWYPYPFLNVAKLGFGTVLRNLILVVVAALVVAAVLKLLDGGRRATADRPPLRSPASPG